MSIYSGPRQNTLGVVYQHMLYLHMNIFIIICIPAVVLAAIVDRCSSDLVHRLLPAIGSLVKTI